MGFEQPATARSRTKFDDGPLKGLVIVFRAAPMSAISAADDALAAYRLTTKIDPHLLAAFAPLVSELSELIDAWSLERDGQRVPIEQFPKQPASFTFRIAERWMLELFDLLPTEAVEVVEEAADSDVFDETTLPMEAAAS